MVIHFLPANTSGWRSRGNKSEFQTGNSWKKQGDPKTLGQQVLKSETAKRSSVTMWTASGKSKSLRLPKARQLGAGGAQQGSRMGNERSLSPKFLASATNLDAADGSGGVDLYAAGLAFALGGKRVCMYHSRKIGCLRGDFNGLCCHTSGLKNAIKKS